VQGVGDRYMSSRHARLHVERGRLWVTDLDSKNRTFLNEEPLPPHQPRPAAVGDTIRMGTTTLRVARVAG
jgi:pSer/pThr/pTyr-binding forkhead associated (FHA) protein